MSCVKGKVSVRVEMKMVKMRKKKESHQLLNSQIRSLL